jgi:hypothetical protein
MLIEQLSTHFDEHRATLNASMMLLEQQKSTKQGISQ